MTTIHIMIDLETWGTEPGSDIRSIGACVFDPLNGSVGDWSSEEALAAANDLFYIACDNPSSFPFDWGDRPGEPPRKYALTRDPQTVQWWSDQSEEAETAFADPVDMREALRRFIIWIEQVTAIGDLDIRKVWDRPNIRIWSHGPSFDPPILAAAYKAVGLPVPWHYRAPRDTRTAFDMAGIEDHSAWLDRYKTGTHHHALDDAICQAKAVCGAYMRLRDDTWEQAALICDETTSWGLSATKLEVAESMQRHCAKAIRAQKSDSPQRAANAHGNHVYPLPS